MIGRRVGALVVSVALLVVACTGSAEPPTTPTTAPSTTTSSTSTTTLPPSSTTTEAPIGNPYGGTAVVAEDQEPPTLNPFAPGGDNFIVTIVGQAYLTGVYEIDGSDLSFVPEVVTELPTVSNGGVTVNGDGSMTVGYTIRDEAVWEDGVPISGDDFAFTLSILQDPSRNGGLVGNPYEDVVSSEATAKTFAFTMRTPTIQYETMFRTIVPKHAVEDSDFLADWNDRMWPSGGPFRFAGWEHGERIIVERNEAYWKTDPETGQQLPYLDAVEFRFIPETEEIVSAFKSREVDIIQLPPANETIDGLKALESDGARVEVRSGPVWEHLNFQFGPGRLEMNAASLNHNLDYRRAVAHLIDKSALMDAIGGYTTPLTSYVDAFSPALSHHSWERYPYDPDTARALLEKVKADEGVEVITTVFSTTSNGDMRVRVSEVLAPMFAAVGIEYRNELRDSQLFFGEIIEEGTWDMGEWAWVGSPGLSGLIGIHDIFDPEGAPPDGSNYYRWGTEDSSVVDEHTARFAVVRDLMNSSVDDQVLRTLLAEAEEILADQMVILPLHSRLVVGAVWEDEIGGWEMNPSQASHTWNIEEWYRADL